MSASVPGRLASSNQTQAWIDHDDDSDDADFDWDDGEDGVQNRYQPWSSYPGFGSPCWWSQ